MCSHNAVQEQPSLASHEVLAYPGRRVTVAIAGELDMSNAAQLQQWIVSAAAAYPGMAVEVDLQGVDYIDSTTVRTLVEAHRLLGREQRRLIVSGAAGTVERVLRTTGVLRQLSDGG